MTLVQWFQLSMIALVNVAILGWVSITLWQRWQAWADGSDEDDLDADDSD
jgi:hypothetical protein